MDSSNKFEVNAAGENTLLSALKSGDVNLYNQARAQGQNPFIPSRYGQCAGGLLTLKTGHFDAIKKEDWCFESDKVYDVHGIYSDQFLEHASTNPLTYTLPYLSGIHLAAATDDSAAIYKYKDQIHSLDAWGYTPMIYAVGCCHPGMFNLLQTLGAGSERPVGSQQLHPLQVVKSGHDFLAPGWVNRFPLPKIQATPEIRNAKTIHQAAAEGDLVAVRTLLEMGVPVEIKSFNGSTPLLCAARSGQKEVFDYLLSWGASRDTKNYLGETPAAYERKNFLVNEQDDTEDLSAAVRDYELRNQLVDAAETGCFQMMVHAYFALDDKNFIPKDLISKVKKSELLNKDLIISWLYLKGCGYSEVNDKLVRIAKKIDEMTLLQVMTDSDSDYLLGYLMRFPIAENASLGNPSLLEYAGNHDQVMAFKWLLRHGAYAYLNPMNLREGFNPDFEYILRDWTNSLQQTVQAEPTQIPDSLLFALTTGESDVLRNYVDAGMSVTARTAYGLSLLDITKLVGSSYLKDVYKTVAQEQGYTVEPEDEAPAEDDKEPEFEVAIDAPMDNEPVKESITTAPFDTHEEEDFFPVPLATTNDENTDGATPPNGQVNAGIDEISDVRINLADDFEQEDFFPIPPTIPDGDEQDSSTDPVDDDISIPSLGGLTENDGNASLLTNVQVKDMSPAVKEALIALPFPQLVIRAFLSVQSFTTDDELNELVKDDKPTLELFRALKLYADDKATN